MDSAYDYNLCEVTGQRIGDKLCESLVTDEAFQVPKLFTNGLTMDYNALYQKDDRLLIDGILNNGDHTPVMSRCYVALISENEMYGYVTRGGLWGRIYCSIDLTELPAGEYVYHSMVVSVTTMIR